MRDAAGRDQPLGRHQHRHPGSEGRRRRARRPQRDAGGAGRRAHAAACCRPRKRCARRRKWRPSASSPAASRMTSTISCRRSRARWTACASASPQGRTDDVERFLKAAEEGASRAAALTHRLLAFSRRQTLDPRPADLNRLVADMEELIRRTMGPPIAVQVDRRRRPVGDARRHLAARERAAESLHQRARRHARGRQSDHRDRQSLARRQRRATTAICRRDNSSPYR